MVTPELESYIREMVRLNLKAEARKELLLLGWPETDIEAGFEKILGVASTPQKQKKWLIVMGLILICLAILVGSGVLVWGKTAKPINIVYRQYSEIGDEIILDFNKKITEELAQPRFSIEPDVSGDLVWVDETNQLHFAPHNGFALGQNYQVNFKRGVNIFGRIFGVGQKFNFVATKSEFEDRKEGEPVGRERIPGIAVKSIDVNLEAMTISLLEDGFAIARYPIAAKGNPWSSPTREGTFTVKTKEPRHFSSLAKVWMPQAMQYSGDYFIHGWPYWPNGTLLATRYSGGCVRLGEGVSEAVFDWAEVGTAITVHSDVDKVVVVSPQALKAGDLVQEEGASDLFLINIVGDKRLKRQFFGNIDSEKVLKVPKGGLVSYEFSDFAQRIEGGDSSVYRVDSSGFWHELQCGETPYSKNLLAQNCYPKWELLGHDYSEIFPIRDEEWRALSQGAPQKI
ncbi:MAG: hypothetical protein COV31_00450 [Candidatus Yanofskybacteria bacterium CG10_big_fil_rev_8_21_14_0_10_46_23]|uniref:L,D-TPase catalytic domain-containing protein n=1 Tax=Candidatus Yanofskybacteria bacterium CG10_big_fil_rev_8_21_14_0_10_46_23 TaxID=1975098 RepID=A0A2H0R5F9_9BACT|nr:MAG: hypothetical protein COV31_00450 [Candidatus Yanofskybacteria bacterium CG10_big_fil_rev_8_21_14_0_10_46_23]